MSMASAVESGRRMMAATFLDRCTLLNNVPQRDRGGGYVDSLVLRLADVPCRFGALNETDIRIIAGWQQGPATGSLFLPVEIEVPEGSFVQQSTADQDFWIVVGDRTPPGKAAVVRRLLIREASWGV